MAFDPSVIGSIGDNAIPDVAGAYAKGFQLRDLVNEDQLQKLKIRQGKAQEQEQSDLKEIYKGIDPTKPEGIAKAAQAAASKGYGSAAMDIMKAGQSIQSGQLQNDIQQAQLDNSRLDFLDSNIGSVYDRVTSMRQQGRTDAEINGAINGAVPAFVEQIKKAPDNIIPPQIKQQWLKQIQAGAGQFNYDKVKEIYDNIPKSRAYIQSRLQQLGAQTKMETERGTLAERERHDRALEANARDKTEKPPTGRYGVKDPTTPQGQQLKEQFMSLTGGKVTLAQLRGLDFDAEASAGKNAQQLVQAGLTYTGQTRAATAQGQRAGNIAILEGSVGGGADQVLDALKGVDRGNIQKVNSAIAAGKTEFGNANEARYATAIQSLINEYSRVISGGTGQSTDSSRAEAHAMLNRAQSPEQVQAVIAQMRREVQIVQQASEKALSGQGGALPTLSQPGAAAPPPAASSSDPLGIRQ